MQLFVCLPVLLLASTWSVSANFSAEVQDVLSRNNKINSLEFVGTSEDGKSFFKDASNSTKTWQESRAFCESFKLTMLTVTSKLQLDFLLDAYKELKVPIFPWTSAREDREPIGMKWDNEEGKPDMSSFVSFGEAVNESTLPYQICGVMAVNSGMFFIRSCSDKQYTLCQISHIKLPNM